MDTINHNINMLFASRIADILYGMESNYIYKCLTRFCCGFNSVRNSKMTVKDGEGKGNKKRKNISHSAFLVSVLSSPYVKLSCNCVRWLIKTLSGRHSPPPWEVQICTEQNNLLRKTDSEGDLCCLNERRCVCLA